VTLEDARRLDEKRQSNGLPDATGISFHPISLG